MGVFSYFGCFGGQEKEGLDESPELVRQARVQGQYRERMSCASRKASNEPTIVKKESVIDHAEDPQLVLGKTFLQEHKPEFLDLKKLEAFPTTPIASKPAATETGLDIKARLAPIAIALASHPPYEDGTSTAPTLRLSPSSRSTDSAPSCFSASSKPRRQPLAIESNRTTDEPGTNRRASEGQTAQSSSNISSTIDGNTDAGHATDLPRTTTTTSSKSTRKSKSKNQRYTNPKRRRGPSRFLRLFSTTGSRRSAVISDPKRVNSSNGVGSTTITITNNAKRTQWPPSNNDQWIETKNNNKNQPQPSKPPLLPPAAAVPKKSHSRSQSQPSTRNVPQPKPGPRPEPEPGTTPHITEPEPEPEPYPKSKPETKPQNDTQPVIADGDIIIRGRKWQHDGDNTSLFCY